MKKTQYRSVFISDTHLCCKDSQADMLYRFLDSFKCEYLYLVGDILDAWYVGKRTHWPKIYNRIMRKLLKMATKGTRVIYVPGNHDELARHLAGYTLGNVVITESMYHRTVDGRRMLVVHGDQFDTIVKYHVWLSHLGGTAYDALIFLNSIINAVRKRFNLPYVSLAGAVRRKVKGAVQVLTNFESTLVEIAKKEGVDGVICGHIHSPAVKEIDGITYLNSGDWIENCSAIVEHLNGDFSIVRAHDLFDHAERSSDLVPDDDEQLAPVPAVADILALESWLAQRQTPPDAVPA